MLSVIDPALVKGRRWTAVLESMRSEGAYTLDLDFFRDIYTITATASRLNSEPGRDRRFSVKGDKQKCKITVIVTKRER